MQSGDNAGTSPISEWPASSWSTPDVPSSHSAPLASARVPIARTSGQPLDETSMGSWDASAGADEQVEESRTNPLGVEGERVTSVRATPLGERDRDIAFLTAGLSHDLNNLLVGVLGNAELAQTTYLKGGDPTAHLLAIRAAAERASALACSMVRFASTQPAPQGAFDLSELVGEIVMLARVGVSKSALVVRGDEAARTEVWDGSTWGQGHANAPSKEEKVPLLVKGDSGRIGQVVLNLIVNGADALDRDGGEVRIDVERVDAVPSPGEQLAVVLESELPSPEGFACLRVADTGKGIPPHLLRRIFDPFFSTKNVGRGLGLANCLAIVKDHGGALAVSSQVGRGTTFEVYLPLSPEGGATTVRANESAVSPEWRTSGRVLVIDDEPMVARLTAMVLEHVGLRPTIEHTGTSALERLAQSLEANEANGFRLCVVDLTMPDLSGQQVLEKTRQMAPTLPVVLTSGFSEQQLRQRGALTGFDGFLQKPFRMSAMVDVLRTLLEPEYVPSKGM